MSKTDVIQRIGNRLSRATSQLWGRNRKRTSQVDLLAGLYDRRHDILDHGMILPDVADFPDLKYLDRFPADVPADSFCDDFEVSLALGDVRKFEDTLDRFEAFTRSLFPPTPTQQPIKHRQYQNLRAMGRQYIEEKIRFASTDRSDLPDSSAYQTLQEDGVYATHIDTSKIVSILGSAIEELLKSETPEVCQPGAGYDRSKTYLNDESNAELFSAIREPLEKQGLLKAASKYGQTHDLDFKHACLHVCSPTDTHFTQTLQDCETTSQLVGMHIDPKPVIKVIIYLNEVTKDSGPFTFIPQSHRWYFDELELLFAKGNSTGNYLNSTDHRLIALQFPERLRKNAIFGRLVPDGTELSKMLLAAERQYTSEIGNCMVFDPGSGIHRGGICHSGQRINLQIALR